MTVALTPAAGSGERTKSSCSGDSPRLLSTTPNGDLVSFTSTLYTCHLVGDDARVVLERDEVHQLGWFDQHHALNLSRRPWTDITLPEAFAWWRARH